MSSTYDYATHRRVAEARETFLSGGELAADLREPIVQSWSRSRDFGVDPLTLVLPVTEAANRRSRLHGAAKLVIDDLAHHFSDSTAGIVLADANGVIVERWVEAASLLRLMDAVNSAPGACLSEEFVGTNGLGSVLEDQNPVSVQGHEHFSQGLVDFSCYGAPIVHPRTGKVEGVVTFLCNVRDSSPLMLPFVKSTSFQIAERLAMAGGNGERQLLDVFRSASRAPKTPTLLVAEDFLFANSSGAELLGKSDRATLWDVASQALDGQPVDRMIRLAAGRDARATARTVQSDDRKVVGTLIKVLVPDGQPDPDFASATTAEHAFRHRMSAFDTVWEREIGRALNAFAARRPLLVHGERGVGKAELARALHAVHCPDEPIELLHAGLADVEGIRAWMARVRVALDIGGTVVLQNLNALDASDSSQLATIIESGTSSTCRLVGTYTGDPAKDGMQTTLRDALCAQITRVPSLEERSGDIVALLDQIARQLDVAPLYLTPAALQGIRAYAWPGNVRQLKRFVVSLSLEHGAATIDFDDLPDDMRVTSSGRSFGEIERFERQAIVNALTRHRGNKRASAEALGMSRATLYRKVHTYHLERY